MTSLRMRVVEAIAQGIAEVTGEEWELYLVEAESALDAMLDCLTESWEEWRDASWELPSMSTEIRLIESLRGGPVDGRTVRVPKQEKQEMRRVEMTWDDAVWDEETTNAIVQELLHALGHPTYRPFEYVRPDTVRVVKEATK